MDDKMFDLMTKMYSEMTEKFKEIDKRFDTIEKKLDEKADRHDIVRLEDKIDNNSKALFDGYIQTYEKVTDVEKKVEDISSRIEKQDVEIRVIKGGRKVRAK